MKAFNFAVSMACAGALAAASVRAEGVSAYIPLNLEPEMERQIERVLILANEPILKRPFAVELVREFEVMEDSKDGLGNFHEQWAAFFRQY